MMPASNDIYGHLSDHLPGDRFDQLPGHLSRHLPSYLLGHFADRVGESGDSVLLQSKETRPALGHTRTCSLDLLLMVSGLLIFIWPTIAQAQQIHDLRLHINDADIDESQRVLASVEFCARQIPEHESSEQRNTNPITIPIHIVVEDWPRARSCGSHSAQFEDKAIQPICSRQITLELPITPDSSRVCTKVLPICEFSPGPHHGQAKDPRFFACAKNGDGTSLYSGSVSTRLNGQSARQAATSTRLGLDLAQAGTNILISAKRSVFDLKSGGFVLETDLRTAVVSEIQTVDGLKIESGEQGIWRFSIDTPDNFDIDPELPLVKAIVQATNLGNYEPNELSYSGIPLTIRDISFYDKAGFSLPSGDEAGSFLSIGTDIDDDGVLDTRDDDRDGDGVVDNIDAFPLLSTESRDEDQDHIGDTFEIQYFGDLSQAPEQDWDRDGLNNLQEFLIHSNPILVDTDQDQTLDGVDAFPLDPQFARDSDHDQIPDLLDVFPWDPFSGRDRDHDGLPDAFELFWFHSTQSVGPQSDPDRDRIRVVDEWKLGSSPLSVAPEEVFLGGGEPDESKGMDTLIVATSILSQPPAQFATDVIGVVKEFAEIEFLVSESADLASLELMWNGSNLLGDDNIVNSGDEPFSSVVIDWSRAQRKIRISGLSLATGFEQNLDVQVRGKTDSNAIDHDRYVFYHGEPAETATNICQFRIASTKPSLAAFLLLIGLVTKPKRRRTPRSSQRSSRP